MNTILAVGAIKDGNVHLRVAPPQKQDSLVLAAIELGRFLYEAGAPRSACVNQHEEAGWVEASEFAAQFDAVDGTLQAMIDYGAELQELEDDMEDRAFWRRGGW